MADLRSELELLNEQDAYNFEHVREFLGHSASLPGDVASVYELLRTTNGPDHLPTSEARIANALFQLCRKHLTLGAMALFRVYSAQMFRETRAAVEAAGIAYAIQTRPDDFKIFQENGTPEARRRARKRFTSAVLFPTDIPELASLRTYYNNASDLSHTNRITFVRHFSRGEAANQAVFYYQDIRKTDGDQIPHFLYWLCSAHVKILRSADLIFPACANSEAFQRERRYATEKLVRFHQQHKIRMSGGLTLRNDAPGQDS